MLQQINIIQQGNQYQISFHYDPVLIAVLKQIPSHAWNPDKKIWTINTQYLGLLLNQIKGTPYESVTHVHSQESIDVNAELGTTTEIPEYPLDLSSLHLKSKPFDHQIDFVKWSLYREQVQHNRNGELIADEMGCVSQDTKIQLNYRHASDKITVSEAYERWSRHPEWHLDGKSFKIRILKSNDKFGLAEIKNIIHKGKKPVYALKLDNGYCIKLTADHEVFTANRGYVRSDQLTAQDDIVVNGKEISKDLLSQPTAVHMISYQYIGIEDTYDIQINTTDNREHNFLANGIVVHNCGKTYESTILALCNRQLYGFRHCLIIVCLNSAKYNWFNDIKKFTHEEPYILGSRIKKRTGRIEYNGGSKDKYDDLLNETMYGMDEPLPYFIIMNIEAVRYGQGRKHLMMELISQKINSGEIGMIMIDEIHKNASMTSQQGKILQQIKKNTGSRCTWIPMTGTPITSKPLDLYLPMFLIGAHNQTSFYKWKQFYCVYGGYGDHEIIAYKNIPQLKQMLKPNMIRRTKDQVMNLPPKIRSTEYIDLTPYQMKLYTDVANGLIQNKDHIVHELNPMTEILKLRQVSEAPELIDDSLSYKDKDYLSKNARLQRLLELVDDIVSNGEKVVIFSNWVMPLHHVYYYLRKKNIGTAVYTGTMSQDDREKQKEMFINKPNCKVFLGTIGAAGVSHTLTVATNMIFYDDPWDAATKNQAEDRIHRAGTTRPVNIYTIVARNTVDERVEAILEKKKNVSGFIVDNKLDIMNNPDLFDYLLGADMKIPDQE